MHGFIKIGVVTLYTSTISGKPMGCREDDHCPAGYFCDADHFFCFKCLDCEDLKRGAPELSNAASSCITSVAECGNCLIGLVPDKASNKCLSPGEAESGSGKQLLPYEWAVISVALFLAFLVCVAAFYVLRNLRTFKIRASTRTSVHSRGNNDEIVLASAPLSPPPYNAVAMSSNPTEHLEESKPFIKPILPEVDREDRESSDNQTARVFNNPTYVRTLQPHTSNGSPTHRDMLSAIHEDGDNSTDNSIPDAVEERSVAPCAASMTSHTKTSPARQDSNNNSDNESVGNTARNVLAQNATSIIINVMKNIDTVQR